MSDIADLSSALGTTSKFLHVLSLEGLTKKHVQFVIDNTAIRKNIVDVISEALELEAQNKATEAAKKQAATSMLDDRRANDIQEDLLRAFLLQIKPDGSLNNQLDAAIALLSETHDSQQVIKAIFSRIGGSSVIIHNGLDGGPKLTYTKIASAYAPHATPSSISQEAKRATRRLAKVLQDCSGNKGPFQQADALVKTGLVVPSWLPPDTTEEEMKAYRKQQILAWFRRSNGEDPYGAELIFANDGLLLALGPYRSNVQMLTQLTEADLLRVRPEVAPYMDEIKATLAYYDLSFADSSTSES